MIWFLLIIIGITGGTIAIARDVIKDPKSSCKDRLEARVHIAVSLLFGVFLLILSLITLVDQNHISRMDDSERLIIGILYFCSFIALFIDLSFCHSLSCRVSKKEARKKVHKMSKKETHYKP